MKNIISFLLLFVFSISFGQQKDTIYGKVKSIREQLNFLDKKRQNMKLFSTEGDYGHYGFLSANFTTIRFHNWWYNTPYVHYSNYYKEFNKNGKPIFEIWFYKDGDTVRTYNYKYDKNDNLIQEKDIYKINDYTCRNYTYDYKNKLKSSIYYVSDDPDLYSYTLYIRDSVSNLIETKYFDEDGESASLKYKYDSENRKISKSIHKPYVYIKKDKSTTFRKDSIGLDKICEKYFYDNNNKLLETHYYDYDSWDNLPSKLLRIEKNIYRNEKLEKVLDIKDTISSYTEYKYDEHNRKIKETFISLKHPKNNRSSEYFYDKKGNIIKLIFTENNKPVVVNFYYKFDKQNNWTKQIKSINGEKLFVWTREIEYYE